MKKHAHGYDFVMYWMSNEKWYRVNYEKDEFELTEEAPEKARKSFELFRKINNITSK